MIRSVLKHYAKRATGKQSVLPPVLGVADASWYDKAYAAVDTYHEPYWRSHYYALWCIIADRLRSARLRRVLDIGCGPGQLARCLFDIAGIESYTGLDFSPKAIEMAKASCPRATFVVGDATTTTIAGEVDHDVVICSEVLEHVPDDVGVISRFNPGIRAICTVPNFDADSHVRHFSGPLEVRERYEPLFADLDVFAVPRFWVPTDVYFLMDGRRRG